MKVYIGDTPQQLEQGLLIDGELWTKDKVYELKAQVEQLQAKLSLIRTKLEDYCYMPDGIDESEVMRNLCLSTPAQCLAEIKAQTVEGFAGYLLESIRWDLTEQARYYANQLRDVGNV